MIIDENTKGVEKIGHYFKFTGDLISDFLDIRIRLFVTGSIEADKWIKAGEGIKAGKWIEAGKWIKAGEGIEAGEGI